MANHYIIVKKQSIKIYLTIILVQLIILIFSLSYIIVYNDILSRNEYEINTLNEELKIYKSKTISMSNVITSLNKGNRVIKTRLEEIENKDNLLKRDIFLYIDKKYQIVPDTISKEIASQISKLSKENNISPELVVGIISVESSFNPMAISSKNARGLMQVMPEWITKFKLKKVSDLHNISTNITCGIKVLKIHIQEANGSISKGLYYYVGKDNSYAGKVYEAIGRFVAFRSTINDIDIDQEEIDDKDNNSNIRGAS